MPVLELLLMHAFGGDPCVPTVDDQFDPLLFFLQAESLERITKGTTLSSNVS